MGLYGLIVKWVLWYSLFQTLAFIAAVWILPNFATLDEIASADKPFHTNILPADISENRDLLMLGARIIRRVFLMQLVVQRWMINLFITSMDMLYVTISMLLKYEILIRERMYFWYENEIRHWLV
jgi:Zn-dependent protease with chaperone function